MRRYALAKARGSSSLATSLGSRGICRRLITSSQGKKEGDISDSFVQLSGQIFKPLEPRFATLKAQLIAGHEAAVEASWQRLLGRLRNEIPLIEEQGSDIIPEISFRTLDQASKSFKDEHRKRGVAIIRDVVPDAEALHWKQDLQDYIAANPQTKAFPPANPQVYELYWSPSQLRARAHPNVLRAQRFLMQFWNNDKNPTAAVSSAHPCSYADRLRIRQPGDSQFALGPHVDGGSCERWEPEGYGRGHVYDKIFEGRWEEYDPFEASSRLPVHSDLYNGAGACSMFRMYQGWLSMSETRAQEGTLLVNPLLGLATAYYLLRPFFAAKRQLPPDRSSSTDSLSENLIPDNWKLQNPTDSWLQGAMPGCGQEFTAALHPHLELAKSMVHIPLVRPGDYVAWHCDTIHSVDSIHAGTTDSSVLYIPACPLTEQNAQYLKRQRDAFIAGTPGPDFPGGAGESHHTGRWHVEDCEKHLGIEGLRALGLEPWDSDAEGLTAGQRLVMDRANKELEFYG